MSNLYAKFTENNDWEGETWHFWIPVEGNQEALVTLHSLIEGDDNESYELDLTPVAERDVDALVRHGDMGYMRYQNKLDGSLVVTPDMEAKIKDPEDDPLYKGGIRDFMQPADEARSA
jgi:hypothetical protein